MTIGGSKIYTCPFCGKKKRLMVFSSGNTFGGKLWSDNKMEAPMLPEVSYIQQCKDCNKYFTLKDMEAERSEKRSYHLGRLSYAQTKEALLLLEQQGFKNAEDEHSVRIFFIHSYNDTFSRSGKEANPADCALLVQNIEALIDNPCWTDEPFSQALRAEYLREIGEYERATTILHTIHKSSDEFIDRYVRMVRKNVEDKTSSIFIVR